MWMHWNKILRHTRRSAITAGLEVTNILQRVRAFRPSTRAGLIFTLHHVRPSISQSSFQPNAHLEITPEYLSEVIEALRDEGFEFIRLTDLPKRLNGTARKAPFAIFTLDDGYRNNRDYALPIFEKFEVPATFYVTKGFAERTSIIWWEVLAALISRENEISIDLGSGVETFPLAALDDKIAFFDRFCHSIWHGNEIELTDFLHDLANALGLDALSITENLTMSSEELIEVSNHPLIELGAHTSRHLAVGRLREEEARLEIASSVEWLENLTGQKPRSFAFPYGNSISAGKRDFKIVQDLGIDLSVTTRPDMIRTDHVTDLSALPRVSLNGYYQKRRYAAALASGIPFRCS